MKKPRISVFLAGLIVGCLLIAAPMFLVGQAEAQKSLGPYMIMHHGNATASPGVFRVNQSTGYISYCYVDSGSRPTVVCTAETP